MYLLLYTGVHLATMATPILLEVPVKRVTAIHKVQLVEIVTQLLANVIALQALEAERVTSVSLDMLLLTVSANVRVSCPYVRHSSNKMCLFQYKISVTHIFVTCIKALLLHFINFYLNFMSSFTTLLLCNCRNHDSWFLQL